MSKKSIVPFSEDDSVKVYLYFYEGKLYAWTSNFSERDNFEKVRSKKLIRKKKELHETEFRNFMSKYKDQQIISIPVEDHGDYILICGTYDENAKLEKYIDEIEHRLSYLGAWFSVMIDEMNIDEDISNAINILLSSTSEVQDNGDVYFRRHLKTYHMFYEMFKDTFA